MKVETDPATGVTTGNLEQPDRNKLAAAKTVAVNMAVANQGKQAGDDAQGLADVIGAYLAANAPKPDAKATKGAQPEPQAK